MRNTLTTQADSVQMAVKSFLEVSDGHNLEHFNLYSWPQTWSNTSGGFQTIGGASTTEENVTCIQRGNRCCVYFGGHFAYEADMLDKEFSEAFYARKIPGKNTWARAQAQKQEA